ncbi:MAG: hypothetical protein F6K10_04355 [Moorea sp. SIO2B7]|nr:hypothetical protein [Moorena sp. SIO2B7]
MNRNIDLVKFSGDGWTFKEEDSGIKVWFNSSGDIASLNLGDIASLNFFDIVPDLPSAVKQENITFFRNLYRHIVSTVNGGIVSVEIIDIKNIPSVEVILKIPQNPTGMSYIGSVTLPFKDFSFVMKYECPEHGMTGIRDTLIAVKIGDELEHTPNGIPIGWMKDPYDSEYDSNARYNLSAQEKYDELFPEHPLTRVRNYLRNLSSNLMIHPDLINYPKFGEIKKPSTLPKITFSSLLSSLRNLLSNS